MSPRVPHHFLWPAMELPKSLAILSEACARNATDFEIVDTFTGFVARISRGGCSFLVGAAGIGIYPVNRAAPFAIARDKAFTHYVLEKAGFRAPQGCHFFFSAPERYRLPPGRTRDDAVRFAGRLSDNFASPLVVKPNSGKGAKLVHYVASSSALEEALDAITANDNIVLVQAFVDQPEFRLFVVDGEIAFAYRKSRPSIEGDGKNTVRALCEAAMRANLAPEWNPLESEYLRTTLSVRGLSLESVLPPGEKLAIDFISNISAGGRFAGFIEVAPDLRKWARKIARTVSLRVTGLDLFSRSELADVNDIIVTDVNGSPNLGTLFDCGHRELVLGVWRQILDKTFDNSWPEGF